MTQCFKKEKIDSSIIFGVDPGTLITGYGIIQKTKNKLKAIDFGCIRPPPKKELQNRYWIIFQGLEHLITLYSPTAICVETQFVKKNVQIAMKLGMARAIVLLLSAKYKIPLFQYPPRKAKLAVVGSGSASKVQVQNMVKVLLGLDKIPTPEDAADALSIAICHANRENLCMNL
jgi:crossover junction endodeoxyribonuclease RuvC